MKKKNYFIVISKDIDDFDPSTLMPNPIIVLGATNMEAKYFNDLSGEISIEVNGDEVFFSCSGKMHHQIAGLQKQIAKKEKQFAQHIRSMKLALGVMKEGLKVARKAIKKNKSNEL